MIVTNENGTPVRRKDGKMWTHLLKHEEKPKVIASILTKQIRLAIRGDGAGFNRRINWIDYIEPGWR